MLKKTFHDKFSKLVGSENIFIWYYVLLIFPSFFKVLFVSL